MTCCAAWVPARPARPAPRVLMRAAEQDTMGELFTKYYRPLAPENPESSFGLQEVNRNLAADTKVTVVLELLDVLDDLERGARLEPDTGSTGSSTLGTLAQKFASRLAEERLFVLQKSFSSLVQEEEIYRE
eukprot:Skav200739  [mRNA]  locus=scaffold274:291056:294241:- [translate_table: standard]